MFMYCSELEIAVYDAPLMQKREPAIPPRVIKDDVYDETHFHVLRNAQLGQTHPSKIWRHHFLTTFLLTRFALCMYL